ncbi:MAG TPA: sensor histidine kinase, partial [Solirubrobacteraceae bacterium]|nr:sensor histidine kinase [Solirubrobacteraceae bacterium]
ALRRGGPAEYEAAIRQAIEDIELETENLRAIITDLRPSLLDDLGLLPAIEALMERRRTGGLDIQSRLDLPDPLPHMGPELETTIYRVLQEALTNVAKHAQATQARVTVTLDGEGVQLQVSDNGVGFDPGQPTRGFGLAGMRERVYLAGGQLEVSPGPSGTVVRVRVPLARADDADRSADQMAS